jgi:hypothetical protein
LPGVSNNYHHGTPKPAEDQALNKIAKKSCKKNIKSYSQSRSQFFSQIHVKSWPEILSSQTIIVTG